MEMLPTANSTEKFQTSAGPDNFLQRVARSISEKPVDKIFARWYNSKGDVETIRTFHGVWAASGEVAHQLRIGWGLKKGDRVVLAFNFGLRFFVVFLGCLRAGIVAVPVYPPNPATIKKSLRKLQLIVASCQPKIILLCPVVNKLRLASMVKVMATGKSGWPDLPYKCPDVKDEGVKSTPFSSLASRRGSNNTATPNSFDEPNIRPEDVAFLQFTSGSTSDPKGVMLTFGNIEHNIGCVIGSSEAEITARGGAPGERVWFSWLPTFHDMGLIQGTLVPFVAGWSAAYCSPTSFMRAPLLWLHLMSKEKSQMTAAPDFAYRLCVRKWNEMPPQARAALNLDLRHIMFMQNAAEPVRVSTVRDFAKTFASVGLPSYAANQAYGLAEHTVGMAATSPNRSGADMDSIPNGCLRASGEVPYAAKHGIHIKIVDPETFREVPTGQTGELWVTSPSMALGYWGKPELSRETFEAKIQCVSENGNAHWSKANFLRTDDLCRVDSAGFLFVEGRLKDLIIVAGRNIYPQDIEFVAQDASPLIRPGCVAAFSETELGGGLELVMEVRRTSKKDSALIVKALENVRRRVIDESGLRPTRVVAIKERSIPKTTSGKIQRRKTRMMLHDGSLHVVSELSGDLAAEEVVVNSKTDPKSGLYVLPAQNSGQRSTHLSATMSMRRSAIQGFRAAVTPILLPPSPSGTGWLSSPRPGTSEVSPEAETKEGPEDQEDYVELVNSDLAAKQPRRNSNKETRKARQATALYAEDVLRIVQAATGIEAIEASDDLLDLGVDSAMSVGISSDLSEAFGCELPPELVFTHPTATLIAEFINSLKPSEKRSIGISDLKKGSSTTEVLSASASKDATLYDSWNCPGADRWRLEGKAWTMGPMRGWTYRITQVLLLVMVILQIFTAMMPARYYIRAVNDLASTNFGGYKKQPWLYFELPIFGRGARDSATNTVLSYGLLRALAPVIWFLTYSVMVIVTKWVVLGSHIQGRIPFSNRTYLTWWYTNTMLNVWEAIGGRWLVGTKLIILFYRLMGAKVAWSAKISVFLRDFDMLDIREGATIDGELYSRRFEASHMVVMPIVVGRSANISRGAVVYGGTKVGQKCVVEPLTVIPPFSNLRPNSVWEGHPAKAIRKGCSEKRSCSCSYEALPNGKDPFTIDMATLFTELAKQSLIVGTLAVLVVMTYIPAMMYASMGLSESFRYAIIVQLAIYACGVPLQLAVFTVLLKWILAGTVTEGAYKPNAFRTLRRWYLGRLHTLVNAYFLTFNRLPRYDWWGSALGMRVGCGSVILCMGTYNPEDAHLVKIGRGSFVSHPLFSVDRPTGRDNEREKKPISIGSQSVVGYSTHLSAGSKLCNRSMTAGYSILRPGEYLPEESATMSDVQSAFQLSGSKSTPMTDTNAEDDDLPGKSTSANFIDFTCTIGALLLNGASLLGSFEVCHLAASLSCYEDSAGSRSIVIWSVAVIAWGFFTSILIVVFKRVFVGDLGGMTAAERHAVCSIHPGMSSPTASDIEQGPWAAQNDLQSREITKLKVEQMMRWRWMQRVLSFSLFEPYFVEPFLKGTWLLNIWVRLMGADVSMGALILGKVSDHGLVKVSDGAVVEGVLYGHRVTLLGDKWSMELAPSTIGKRGIVHAHTTSWSADVRARTTVTAASATLSGQVLQAGEVYGGRPPKKLRGQWPS